LVNILGVYLWHIIKNPSIRSEKLLRRWLLMDKSEYLQIYDLKTNFWWYKILHELVDFTISKNKKEREIKILIINLPAFEYLKRPHDKAVLTKKRYRKREFVNDLKKIGFIIISSSYRMPHLYFIILISKLFKGKSDSKRSESDLKELPDWLNTILIFLGRIENSLLKRGFCIPVGSSLFVVAKKL